MPDRTPGRTRRPEPRSGWSRRAAPTRWFPADAASGSMLEIRLRHPVTSVAMTGQAGGSLGPGSARRPSPNRAAGCSSPTASCRTPCCRRGGDSPATTAHSRSSPTTSPRARSASGHSPGGQHRALSVRPVAGSAAEPTAAAVSSPHGVRVVRAVTRRFPAGAPPGVREAGTAGHAGRSPGRPRPGRGRAARQGRRDLELRASGVQGGLRAVTQRRGAAPAPAPGWPPTGCQSRAVAARLISGTYWRHARSPAPHRHRHPRPARAGPVLDAGPRLAGSLRAGARDRHRHRRERPDRYLLHAGAPTRRSSRTGCTSTSPPRGGPGSGDRAPARARRAPRPTSGRPARSPGRCWPTPRATSSA